MSALGELFTAIQTARQAALEKNGKPWPRSQPTGRRELIGRGVLCHVMPPSDEVLWDDVMRRPVVRCVGVR